MSVRPPAPDWGRRVLRHPEAKRELLAGPPGPRHTLGLTRLVTAFPPSLACRSSGPAASLARAGRAQAGVNTASHGAPQLLGLRPSRCTVPRQAESPRPPPRDPPHPRHGVGAGHPATHCPPGWPAGLWDAPPQAAPGPAKGATPAVSHPDCRQCLPRAGGSVSVPTPWGIGTSKPVSQAARESRPLWQTGTG